EQLCITAGALIDLATLSRRSTVAPQQRRPDHRGALIEKDGRVHLAGDADRGDTSTGALRQHIPDRRASGRPPGLGILLRPTWLWRIERKRRGGARRHAAVFSHENRLNAARADVDAEKQSANSQEQLHRKLIEPLVRVPPRAQRREVELGVA